MEKELKKLPENANRDSARRTATKEYQQVEKIMKAYLQTWYQNTFYQRESSTRIEVTSNTLVYVDPAVVAERPTMRQESIAKAMRVEEPTIGVR
jgi:hypothetical protein